MSSMAYQPFPIKELRSGISTYTKEWIRPKDAFDPLVNAYIYRGFLTKRAGSIQLGDTLADGTPVMGIMNWIDPTSGQVQLIVASEDFAYKFVPGPTANPTLDAFTKITSVSNSQIWAATVAPGALGPIPTFWTTILNALNTITVTITDASGVVQAVATNATVSTTIDPNGWIIAPSSFVFATGLLSLTLSGAATGAVRITIAATLDPTLPYFSGTIANFFNWTNWQPTSPSTFQPSTAYLYMTNSVDPVTLYDGANLARPGFYITQPTMATPAPDRIVKALDVQVYNNRLLLVRPQINTATTPDNQGIYFSAPFSPFNFVNNVAGNGGALSAATGDLLRTDEFLRDDLIVSFSSSTWAFQRTGIAAAPFVFRKLNDSKATNCPYGAVDYDTYVTNIGQTGLTACDGVNVERYDLPIIDYYEDEFSQQYYNQACSTRYDNLSQAWTFYVSNTRNTTDFPIVDGVAPGSDRTLVYNFLEKTFCVFQHTIPMTCLGTFISVRGTTWANAGFSWEDGDSSWDSYGDQFQSLQLLGGTTDGRILILDAENAVKDGMVYQIIGGDVVLTGGNSFSVEIFGTRWNPYVDNGQKTQFGYIDIYYSTSSIDPDDPIQLTLFFYVDNKEVPSITRLFTLDGPSNSSYAWKRIYLGLVGEFIQMEIDPSEDSQFELLGFILWARPSGRITPP